jgi:hypothetical protein
MIVPRGSWASAGNESRKRAAASKNLCTRIEPPDEADELQIKKGLSRPQSNRRILPLSVLVIAQVS